jgi:hypothetical protein
LRQKPQDNAELTHAFPGRLLDDARIAITALPANPYWFSSFEVQVDAEKVAIPRRIYHNDSLIRSEKLSPLQKELIDCILTRHHDGFVRERYLSRIVTSNHTWIAPFVVQLLGEYVIEIIRMIDENLGNLDAQVYAHFLSSNEGFLALTENRVISYWNCYYRSVRKEEYPGFRVLRFFTALVGQAH